MPSTRSKPVRLRSYGGLYETTAEVAVPGNLVELRTVLAAARAEGRSVSLSGAGLSFDNQWMNDDLVVSLRKLDHIRVLPEERAVEVGPGAAWGDIFKQTYAHGLLPYILITGTQPTAGGTLSVHTNSVFTPCCGKEGKHVIELDLMLADGSVVTCSRTQHAELFHAAIAGFGSVGVFTRIKYRLLPLGGPTEIVIDITHHDDVDDLERRFSTTPGGALDDVRDVWAESSLFFFDAGRPKMNLYRRRYARTDKARTRQSFPWGSLAVSPVIRFLPGLANRILARDSKRRDGKHVHFRGMDDLFFGTFWAQPDFMLNRALNAFGYRAKIFQNSYFIPLRGNHLTRFTQSALQSMPEHGLTTAMFDIMFIPKDEPFLLSPSKDEAGFYVNITFMDFVRREAVEAYYAPLNDQCVEMGGKMNLAKNAFIAPARLEAMYRGSLEQLVALKRTIDPGFLFNSSFLREKFPSYFGAQRTLQPSSSQRLA